MPAKKKPSTRKKSFSAKKNIDLDKIRLTEEFKSAFELIESTSQCVFLTGKAGTGKSTFLRYFRANTKKRVAVVAPTGIAAINIEGQTIHSFFRFPPRLVQKSDVQHFGSRRALAQNLDVLVIDEASMVRADLLDGMDHSLQINRGSSEPFGGVQIVVIGDLYQLPPIVGRDMKEFYDRIYPSPYLFSASSFQKVDFRCIEFTHIFRQSNARFISLLNSIRENHPSDDDFNLLARRVLEEDPEEGESEPTITLTPRNDSADRINAMHLAKIKGLPHSFTAAVSGEFRESDYPNEFRLTLKKGAQIMMIKNDVEQQRWVNGSLGVIEAVSDSSIQVNIGGKVHEVLKNRWEKIQYKYDEGSNEILQEVTGTFGQFPLRLAWAITIHKSQGQTFEDVIIDLQGGAFTHGQVYVALSRCTSLEGLRLTRNIRPADIIFDQRVVEFHKRFSAHQTN